MISLLRHWISAVPIVPFSFIVAIPPERSDGHIRVHVQYAFFKVCFVVIVCFLIACFLPILLFYDSFIVDQLTIF